MDAQTKAFQALKPVCVALGEAAKLVGEGKTNITTVTNHLECLKRVLATYTARPGALHPKLAEYVFFPISQVLRASQKASIHCLELCLQCIAILVDQGWRQQLPAQTAAQLVILCTLLADKEPPGLPFAETTEELQASAFWCLYHIFIAVGKSDEARSLLTTEEHFPQLGQTISVTLNAMEDSNRITSQAAASSALEALLTHVADREVHASFLPGIFSKLTKTLTPSSQGRTSPKVLAQCLQIVKLLLKSTLGMASAWSVPKSSNSKESIIDQSWQENAAAQLKPALANIMRLQSHTNDEVKLYVGSLCILVLRECNEKLANCSSIALETLVAICMLDRNSSLSIEFEMLLHANPKTSSALQELLYEWLQSLPTQMQSAEEEIRLGKIRKTTFTYRLLADVGLDTTAVDRIAAAALQDSVVVSLTVRGAKEQAPSFLAPLQDVDLAILRNQENGTTFSSPLIKYKGQERTMQAIQDFASGITEHGSSTLLTQGLSRSLHQSHGEALLADFWLLLVASGKALQAQQETVALLVVPDGRSPLLTEELDELYSFALNVLTSEDEGVQDPRLQALALQAVAMHAQSEGQNFRFELMDALYPILHMLATPDEMLQRTSITTLNILTSACGYASVRDLIVENVDYLVNAVALKLNAFDVSPQAPQVLLMMLRLAGPTLLPYLEDTVESIFAALEDFHGYPLLVELLFKVLGVMAEEGVKTPQLTLEAGKVVDDSDDFRDRWVPTTVEGLATQLKLRAQDDSGVFGEHDNPREPHPKRPWGKSPEVKSTDEADDFGDEDDEQPLERPEPEPPARRTYALLLKITELTQHFLPSASPSLRTSLLALIRRTAPALAKHENSFLPLINTLWPEVVSRLDDAEAHIIATGLDIVRVLCESAKDFMRTRIVQLWPRLVEIHRSVSRDILQSSAMPKQSTSSSRADGTTTSNDDKRLQQALVRMEASPTTYSDTSSMVLWSALHALLPAVVRCVHLPPEILDEALAMATPMLKQHLTRSAFEEANSDALWLALLRSDTVDRPVMPVIPEDRHWQFAAVAG